MPSEPHDPRWEAEVLTLARGSRAQARRATTMVVDRLGPTVLRLARRMTRSEADARDAMQETFVAVDRGLAKFRGEARISTWVHRIAVRASLRVAARVRRVQLRAREAKSMPPAGHADPMATFEELEELRRALASLQPDHRAILALTAEGFTGEECAAVLGLPVGTVWSRLHLARRALRAALGDDG